MSNDNVMIYEYEMAWSKEEESVKPDTWHRMLHHWWRVKGSVSTAFAVWKYFSCIKKQLILCFDETKIDLKPLIMLF